MTLILRLDRVYKMKCPGCYRVVKMRLDPAFRLQKSYAALPSCVGGPRPHPPTMLACEDYDVYREMYDRFERGAPLAKPTITPRNFHRFPRETPGEKRSDYSIAGAR